MAFTYQTEYRLGRPGRPATRSYSGVRALILIAAVSTIGLVFGAFGLIFGVIGWSLRLVLEFARLILVTLRDVCLTLVRFARDAATLPWRTSLRLRSDVPAGKPSWASYDEF